MADTAEKTEHPVHEKHDAMAPEHLFGHVKDSDHFELPRVLGGEHPIPQPFKLEKPLVAANPGAHLEAFDLKLTKFMVLEVVVALLVAFFFITVAKACAGGDRPRGRFWNLLETFLVYIRDHVARPAIDGGDHGHDDGHGHGDGHGHHHKRESDKFLPFLWTLFFFILGCNLMGMLPWAGSPTGSFATTAALALITFGVVVGAGFIKLGPKYITSLVPHMDLPLPLMIVLWPLIFVLELVGLLIKHFVLAIRLLANVFAGHLVLAVILAFIAVTAGSSIWGGVAAASVLGSTALSLLELFVAFLQAYIFTFLAALFIGMSVHPH